MAVNVRDGAMSSIRKRIWQTKGEEKTAWIVDYKDQEGVSRLKTFAKKKDAQAWMDNALFEVRQGTHTAESASITVGEAGERWLCNAEDDKLEEATVRQYRQHVDLHIRPYLANKKLSELTVPLVNKFARTLARDGRSPPMVKKIMTSLGSLISDAQEAGEVARNVVRERSPRRRGKGQEKRNKRLLRIGTDIPSPDEIRRILAEGRRPIVVTAIFTGMRASELRGLMWESVDFEGKVIHVQRRADRLNKIGPPKSAAGQRSIPMTPMVLNTLREWKLRCPPSEMGLVFPNGAGNVENHTNLYRRVFGQAQIEASVTVEGRAKYGLHAFRHFYASWLLGEKARGGLEVSPKRAQTLLGHSSITMTMDVYGHLLPPKSDEAGEFAAGERALLS